MSSILCTEDVQCIPQIQTYVAESICLHRAMLKDVEAQASDLRFQNTNAPESCLYYYFLNVAPFKK